MINIRQKTANELKEEESLYRFGAAVAHGIPREVCPTYLVKRDGTKVDTWDLTEEQILGLIEIDLVDYSSPRGTYKKEDRHDLDAFKLASALKGKYIPSVAATLKLSQLETQYGHIVKDLIGSIGAMYDYEKARTVATFLKESNGEFEPATSEEIISILEQMVANEKMKKFAGRKK